MVVIEILAIAAVFALAFALLFRDKPIEFRLTIKHETDLTPSHLEEMKAAIGKDEQEILDQTENILGFVNRIMAGELTEDRPKEDNH